MQHMDGRMDGVGMFTNIKLLQKYQPSAASNPASVKSLTSNL